MNPELHRPITPERITPHGTDLVIEATAAECQALAADIMQLGSAPEILAKSRTLALLKYPELFA